MQRLPALAVRQYIEFVALSIQLSRNSPGASGD
jgi:hypothetical protein